MNKILPIIFGIYAFLACTDPSMAAEKSRKTSPTSKQELKKTDKKNKLSSGNSPASMKIKGRIQADAAVYDHAITTMGDGTELRRVQLGVEGIVFKNWGYDLTVDFANNQVDLKDVYIVYTRFKPLSLLIGQFKEPVGLDELTSSNYITFMERALPTVFAVGRKLGIGARSYGELNYHDSYSAAIGVFGEEQNVDVDNEGNEGHGVAARVAMTHFFSKPKHYLVAAGGSFAYIYPRGNSTVQYDPRPESHVTNVRLVDTGGIPDVNSYAVYGAEAIAQFHSVLFQGEYLSPSLDRKRGLSDPRFDGWYGQISWLMTGESREYDPKKAVFKGVKPIHRYGAWELAGRFSGINLNDRDIFGGREKDITAGLNWYPNPYVRFMFNYIKVYSKRGNVSDNPNVFMLRAQVFFAKNVA